MSLDKLGKWLQDTLQPGSEGKEIKHFTAKDFQSGKKSSPKIQRGSSSRSGQSRSGQSQSNRSRSNRSTHSKNNSQSRNHSGSRSTNFRNRNNRSQSSNLIRRGGVQSNNFTQVKGHQFKSNFRFNRSKTPLRVIALGGLDEIGKNMMIFEFGNDIIIVDMGFEFPSSDLLGIDYVVPDVTYLEERRDRIRGVIITHGHLDHTGGIPYILPRLGFPPVFGTKLTMGLVEKKLDEFKFLDKSSVNAIDPDETLKLGQFHLDFFRVNHSIPGCIGVAITTPVGTVVHTGDFKFDYTPADNTPTDFHKLALLGTKNVLALFSDSTNAIKPGHTLSERKIGENLDKLIRETQGRMIIASFSSLIGRINQIIQSAQRYRRKIYVSGRSMIENIKIAQRLGYIQAPPNFIHDIRRAKQVPGHDAIILTTGSQGEDISALSRMSMGVHPQVAIKKGDTVVISATPVPGNEISMYTMINNLCRMGAHVVHHKIMDVHTSGHGCQEDLKLMMSLVRPKFLVPVHGEYYMRQAHGDLAQSLGMEDNNIVLVENGNVIEFNSGQYKVKTEKIETNYILVDGSGEGSIASDVISERQSMSQNGVVIITFKVNKTTRKLVGDPEVTTKGFIYQTETKHITKEIKEESRKAFNTLIEKDSKAKAADISRYVTARIDRYSHKKLGRQPLIVPMVLEV